MSAGGVRVTAALPLDRAAAPRPGSARPFHFPRFVHQRLLPGLDLYAAHLPRAPLVSLELILPRGGQADPPGARGLASLTADLLDEGTRRRSGPELAALVERLGGSLSTSADWDGSYLACTLLAQHLASALELTAEVSLEATLPAEELERLRRRRLAELVRRRGSPTALADERLAAVLYGDGAYGPPLIGSERDLLAVDRDSAFAFYEGHLRRGGATLVAAGDLDPAAVAAAAAGLLGDWPREPPPRPTAVEPLALPGIVVAIVDRPHAAQTELRIGHAGPPRQHPDRVALAVLNSLLGGKFTSRINLNLRERHGYTYGAHSSFASRRGPGPFQVSTAVANEVAGAAASEVLHELRRLQEEPVGSEELADAIRYLEGVFPYTLQTVESVAQRLVQLAVFELPDDYFDSYPERLHAVTVETVQRMARLHLRPAQCAIVAVGPAETLLAQLESFGPATVTPAVAG
jgi:zinc protease